MSFAFKRFLFLTIIFLGSQGFSQSRSKSMPLEEVKSKIADAVLLRQRDRALDIVTTEIDFISTTSAAVRKDSKREQLLSLKQNILNQFYSEKTQNVYEEAAISYIFNKRKAAKNISICLESEPKNINCLWLDLKMANFYNEGDFESKSLKYIDLVKDLPETKTRILILENKFKTDFSEKNMVVEDETKKSFEKKTLDLFMLFDQQIAREEFDKAKETVAELEKMAPDHPDLAVMQAKLNPDKTDFSNKVSISRNRCLNLSADIIRKYIFDIDFCRRG